MKLLTSLTLLWFPSGYFAAAILSGSNEDSNLINFKPSRFTQTVYKATIINNNNISYMDNPVVMENGNDDMYFVITSDNYMDYALHLIAHNDTHRQEIQLELISSNPIHKEFDVVILEALNEEMVPISRTTVLLFNPNMNFDMYKMTFSVDDREYIVLNFFYFKWFLALLTVTGFLILVIELHEVMRNLRISKEANKNGKYHELLTV